MPTLPILPGPSLPGVVQPAAPTAPVAPVDPTADPASGGSFVDQLAAALAALVAPQPATPTAQAPADDLAADTRPEPSDEDKDPPAEPQADVMVELLASSGLVPTGLVAPTVAAPNQMVATGTSDGDDHSAPLAATTVALPPQTGEAPVAMPTSAPASTDDGPGTPGTADADQPSAAATEVRPQLPATPDAKTPAARLTSPTLPTDPAQEVAPAALQSQLAAAGNQPSDQRAKAAELRAELTVVAPAASNVRSPQVPGAANALLGPRAPGAPEATPNGQPVAGPATSATHAGAIQAPPTGAQTSDAGQHGQAAHDGFGHSREGSAVDSSSPTTEPSPADSSSQTTPFAAVAPMQTTNINTPDAPRPRDVVDQIAHQAELYRLPGGRGVRIQLHPDGLGGVEVTVRYGNSGALELHVNVEHAATGALVEAGWNDLRDALSQQGISPDRLVMSVSGPQGGGLSSDSGGFGSGSGSGFNFRSDGGAMGFGQSPQGQSDRQPTSGARTRWAPSMDAQPQEETAAPASTSRIDLRV